jgi:hypothetical protein
MTFYKHVVVDIPHVYMKHVVGKQGKLFKNYCKTTGVNQIWYNTNRKIVEIYGPKDNLENAKKMIETKMNKVKKRVSKDDIEKINITYTEDVHVSGSLEGVLTKEDVKYLIGKDGKHFKRITKLAGVSFIWYNEDENSVSIWGLQENLQTAISLLYAHIEKVKSAISNRETQDMELC